MKLHNSFLHYSILNRFSKLISFKASNNDHYSLVFLLSKHQASFPANVHQWSHTSRSLLLWLLLPIALTILNYA